MGPIKSMSLFQNIQTRRPQEGEEGYSLSFGGTTLYANSQKILADAVYRLEETLEKCTADHQTLVRHAIVKLTRDALGESIPDRIFGAVFGRMLGLGVLTTIPCRTINGRILRVYINTNSLDAFHDDLNRVRELLKSSSAVATRTVQRRCHPDRGWGTYATSQHLLSHLVFLGQAVYVDEDLFTWPTEIENAVRKSSI